MTLTLSNIQDHVRSVVDLDTTELSNTFLNVMIQEGFDSIVSRSRIWPEYEQTWTFTTIPTVQTYALATIEPASTDVAEILTIIDTTAGGYALEPVAHEHAEKIWRNTLLYSGIPTHWSMWADTVYLWPKPSNARTLSVRSYREPLDWIGASLTGTNVPDVDSRLHTCVALYALARVYSFQEEPQLAGQYMQLFETQLAHQMREIFRPPHRQVMLNRGIHSPSFEGWLKSLGKIQWP